MDGALRSRSVLSLLGEDARTFLQGLVTQDVAGETATFAALLTPQGKILFDFFVVPTDGGYLIDCDAAAAPSLLKRLSMYRLRAKVMLAAEEGLAVHVGDAAGARTGYPDPRLEALPSRMIAKKSEARPADDDYDALRLSLGVPEFGRDFGGEEVFLLDVNYDALAGVSYKKGCFVGQEVTSRMKRKGEVRKRTLIVHGAGLATGAEVRAGDAAIGVVMSTRKGAGLALIRIDRLAEAHAAATPITVGEGVAAIQWPPYLSPV